MRRPIVDGDGVQHVTPDLPCPWCDHVHHFLPCDDCDCQPHPAYPGEAA